MTNAEIDIKLILPLATYRKIMAYATICDTELTGFADLEYNAARKALIAGEVYLMEQTAGGADCHIEEEQMSKFNLDLIKKGVNQLPRLWWHSHVNMEAFFSGTDEATMEQLQNETFITGLVVNKRREMKAKMFLCSPVIIEIDPLPVQIELEYERIPETLRKEVEKKVKAREFKNPKWEKWDKTKYDNDYIWGKQKQLPMNSGTDKSIERHRLEEKIQKEKMSNVLWLPKDPEEAQERIEKFNLERIWNDTLNQFVYKNPLTGILWVDYWKAIEKWEVNELEETVKQVREEKEREETIAIDPDESN